jgi:uncharacterized protein (UPF0335 family)
VTDFSNRQETERKLLADDIRRIVAEAKAAGQTLQVKRHAARLFVAHHGANRSVSHIIDQLSLGASSAGVEIDRRG